jgi:glycolate oxidase FAD binding subunit
MSEPGSCLIDDFGPLPIRAPQSVADLGDAVRQAAAEGLVIYPLGGGTMLGLGLPPTRDGIALATTHLDRVIDYPARDMTVTVETGITLTRLQALLATEHQRLPIDVPCADRATLGGALAANVSGPRRYGFGTLRDYVIGISLVNDEGLETKAGGRVVKNVAGYDLCKLYVGSLGTLGIITQVTLKLRPRPEEQALVTIGCADDAVASLLDTLHRTRTRPVCVDLLNQAAARAVNAMAATVLPDAPWLVVAGFEDNREAVSWQVQQLIKEVSPLYSAALNVLAGAASEPLWQGLVELPAWPGTGLTFRANLLPEGTAAFCRRAAGQPEEMLIQAHAGNGLVVGHLPRGVGAGRAAGLIKELLDAAVAARGNLVVPRCPAAWKKELPVWGAPRGDAWLMRRVKEALDPHGLFNPGRFVDGI